MLTARLKKVSSSINPATHSLKFAIVWRVGEQWQITQVSSGLALGQVSITYWASITIITRKLEGKLEVERDVSLTSLYVMWKRVGFRDWYISTQKVYFSPKLSPQYTVQSLSDIMTTQLQERLWVICSMCHDFYSMTWLEKMNPWYIPVQNPITGRKKTF